MKKFLFALLLVPVLLTGCNTQEAVDTLDTVAKTIDGTQKVASASEVPSTNESTDGSYDQILYFNDDKYPETANHIETAIEKGESSVCTIDRDGADANRDDSLDGVPTKKGYDRDEWPMAMCEEGGTGADIMYITPSDNRGAGSWVSHQLSDYPDGTKVKFVVGN